LALRTASSSTICCARLLSVASLGGFEAIARTKRAARVLAWRGGPGRTGFATFTGRFGCVPGTVKCGEVQLAQRFDTLDQRACA
jgi:hypothetical protein